ncbi:hypothetical protein CLV47_102110 [Antricoccus suffuscus]|uniref:PknH-like protein n=1 Tax=Antricoccus suffuscus TaxID=1629062 RepID=A0A2T1A4F2_9ACTN|nr:hypothetical protein [Antricoccus suffuscus]PRZ43424.1 hypothetical protein CLV47_102110 [Antricoccus suffuscus]
MKKAVAAMSAIAVAVIVLASGCTTVIKDATATPPKVEKLTQASINERVPKANFFGSNTTEPDDFQTKWMYFCSGEKYPATDSIKGVEPYAKGYTAKGSLPFNAERGDFGVNVYALPDKKAATSLADNAISDMKNCKDTDNSDGGSGDTAYTIKSKNKEQDYSHGAWQGYAIHTESVYTPSNGGDKEDSTILAVVAYRANVVALLNIYAYKPDSNKTALDKSTTLVDKFLDALDNKK